MSTIRHTAKARIRKALAPRKVVIVDSRSDARAQGAMPDRDFLIWLHARLQNIHGESAIVDYMHKLRAIIAATPADQATPNDGRGQNSLEALQVRLRKQAPIALAVFRGTKRKKSEALIAYAKGGA